MKSERHKRTPELYAVLDRERNVLYSSGGSSKSPKLMTYGKEISAQRALANQFSIEDVVKSGIKIEKIYSSQDIF